MTRTRLWPDDKNEAVARPRLYIPKGGFRGDSPVCDLNVDNHHRIGEERSTGVSSEYGFFSSGGLLVGLFVLDSEQLTTRVLHFLRQTSNVESLSRWNNNRQLREQKILSNTKSGVTEHVRFLSKTLTQGLIVRASLD